MVVVIWSSRSGIELTTLPYKRTLVMGPSLGEIMDTKLGKKSTQSIRVEIGVPTTAKSLGKVVRRPRRSK